MNLPTISNAIPEAFPKNNLLGKILRLPLRLIPRNTEVRILQGPLRGKKWIAGSSVHGCWLGSWEYSKQKIFAATVRPGSVVFDIGAHVGFYSLLSSALVGPEGQVFSFEPVPENLVSLRRHLSLNGVQNCTVLPFAVSDSSGTAQFTLGDGSSQGGFDVSGNETITVQTVSIDDLLTRGEVPVPDLIKCDVEGAEFDVLRGAIDALARHPTIFLATHGRDVHAQCCKFLQEIGYRLTALDNLELPRSKELLALKDSTEA